MDNKVLENFTKLVLKIGVNLQRGQGLEVACPTSQREVGVAFAKSAYQMGAKIVRIRWSDEDVERLTFKHADSCALNDIPKWFVDSKMDLVKNNFCYVAVSAENPKAFEGLDPQKIAEYSKAKSFALKKFSQEVMSNGIRWCVVSVPTNEWAEVVFPNDNNAFEKLEKAIISSMRLDSENPLLEWENHIKKLNARADFLNFNNFSKLIFKNSIGTNLLVGLCEDHVWISAQELAKDGVKFVANMPTEEIFTAPHKLKVDGVVKSAMPLCFNGNIIDDFSITFKKGKVVDFTAKKGYEILKSIIETDSGSARLGEVALIGKNSPIAKAGTLLYNTLFDENASCHLAFGKGYPTTVKKGDLLPQKELSKKGLNHSVEHVDFMIGTKDLSVIGVKENGEEITIFDNGDWTI